MFDMLSREELWELYWCLRDATKDVCQNASLYKEMDSLRKEVYEVINPWPPHPVLI